MEETQDRVLIESSKAKILFQNFEDNYETKTKAAEALGLTITYYSKYSKSRVNSYPKRVIEKMCKELNKPLNEVISKEGYEKGKISAEFHDRVIADSGCVRLLFKTYEALFETRTSAAESVDLNITTFVKYADGKVRTYPLHVLEKVCQHVGTPIEEVINNQISLKTIRGSKNRHKGVKDAKKFNGDAQDINHIQRMKKVRTGLKEKYGDKCYDYLSKLALKMNEEKKFLYDEAERLHNLLKANDYTLDELIQKSSITEENTIYLIDEMVKDSLIMKKEFTYSFYIPSFEWRIIKEEVYQELNEPLTTKELIQKTGLKKKKLKVFLYKLKEEGKIIDKFDSRITRWFREGQKNTFKTLSDFQKNIIIFLYYNPNSTNKNMRDKIRVSTNINHTRLRKRLNYNLNQLRESGFIQHEAEGRMFYYSLTTYGMEDTPMFKEEEKRKITLKSFKKKLSTNQERMKNFLIRKNQPEKE